MDLLLNKVLNLSKEEIQNSKIEFNMKAGSGGQPFLDRWLKHSEIEKSLVLVSVVPTGAGMENNAISFPDSGYSVLHE
jgi:hypothetical protein